MALALSVTQILPMQVFRATLADLNALEITIGAGIRLIYVVTETVPSLFSHAGTDGGALSANFATIPVNTALPVPVGGDIAGFNRLASFFIATLAPPAPVAFICLTDEAGARP